ncbi:MAG: sensor histidine kinase [Acidimicrobiales bacterium]
MGTQLHQAVDRAVTAEDARRRLERALDHVSEGVVICDGHGVMVSCNAHAAPFVEPRHAEVLAERAVGQLLEEALAGGGQTRTIELYGPPRRVLAVSSASLADHTGTTGAVAVVHDVTEQRRLEAVRRDFVANVSHELKTPVAALTLLAETLAQEDEPRVVQRLTDRILAESQRVSRIIADLLDLSRIESEESPIREAVAVDTVVAEATERVRPTAEQRSIALIDTARDGPPGAITIRGDRLQLVSAVANLLENAVNYSEAGSAVEVRVQAQESWCDIVVCDHGIGIPSRDLERIFERFYRVDPARARATGGTGLGLAIVRHTALAHRGEILVESREGVGSTFTLHLPWEGEASPEGEPPMPTRDPRASDSI